MDNIHFLNIEYLLLRAYDLANGILTALGLPLDGSAAASGSGGQSPDAHIASLLTFGMGELLLIGMVLTVLLVVLVVWVRIKLLVTEHEGFHEHEHEVHEHQHEEGAHEPQAPAPKNAQWDRVWILGNSQNESDWRRAILEADTMLGDLLEHLGYRGKDIGEKLRDANPLQFSTLDLAWKAHRVRNEIAHGAESFHLSAREANATIDMYRRVFEEFDYI